MARAEIRQYWDLRFQKPAERLSLKDAENELSNLLAESVELHMIADVPVGVLLSGGVDSTAVLSFAAERTDKEISSFTVGFSDSSFADERPYAKLAAETFGTQHHDMTITASDFAEFLPQYVWHMEEPVCEPPAVAMYYVSKLAKELRKSTAFGRRRRRSICRLRQLSEHTLAGASQTALCRPNGAASWGLSRLSSWFHSSRLAKYYAFDECDLPRLLLQPHINPLPILRERFE